MFNQLHYLASTKTVNNLNNMLSCFNDLNQSVAPKHEEAISTIRALSCSGESIMLILRGDDLHKVLDPPTLIDAIANAFALYSEGRTVTPPRTVMWVEGNWWGIMQSYVPNYGVGVKAVNIIPANAERGLPTINAIAILLDSETGKPLALLDGTVLTGLRTAAACALSVKLMAPEKRGALSIIGTGYQARYILRFVSTVFTIEKLKLFDIDRRRVESFASFARAQGIENIVICTSIEDALRDATVVIESTTATEPVIRRTFLTPPVHVVSIGVRGPQFSTVDPETVAGSEVVAVDSRKAVLEEVADIRIPLEKGLIKEDKIVEIGEIVVGKREGRLGSGITLFKSVGLAIQDTIAAALAYRKAMERNIGAEIKF